MRIKSSMVAISVVAALALTACGSSSENNGGTSPAPGNPGERAALTIAKPDGTIAVENNNPWIGDSSALKLGYVNAIFEPLAIVNLVDTSQPVVPWLASEFEWTDGNTKLVVTARDGVTWNDGTPFTAEDIAFTFELTQNTPEIDTGALGITEVSLDGNTVTISFENSMFVKQDRVLHRFIVPKHIWEGVDDVTTEINLNPVGTGPYTLTSFTDQSVTLSARDDYWGGELAVPTLYYVSYADNTALATALASGDADWAQAVIPNVKSAYLDKDLEHNVNWPASGLSIDTMFVNTTKKPFSDVAFRKAVNMVVDRGQHVVIAREGNAPLITSITGLPPAGEGYVAPEFAGQVYRVDVEGARKVLEDAGYTWSGETLIDPDGDAVTFALSVPTGWTDYVTGISLISESVKALGVEAAVETPDVDTWWGAKSNGELDAFLHWTDGGATPFDLYSGQMDGRFLQPIGEYADFNFGRYDNPEATAALANFVNAQSDAERAEYLAIIQRIFVEDVPTIPIGTRPNVVQYNTRNYVGWPSEDNPFVNADPTQPSAVLVLTSLRPAN